MVDFKRMKPVAGATMTAGLKLLHKTLIREHKADQDIMKVKYWLSTDRHVHRRIHESDVGNSVTIFGILIFSLSLLYLLTAIFGKRMLPSKASVKKTKKVGGGKNH